MYRNFKDGITSVNLKAGQKFTFHVNFIRGDETQVTIHYWQLPKKLKKGDILIADYGRIEFVVENVTSRSIETKVKNDGVLGQNKTITIIGVEEEIVFPFMSYQDTVDIDFAVRNKVDFISASSVSSQEDIEEIRSLPGVRDSGLKILAKIENKRGIENIKEIISASDGIIITRSDIVVESPIEKVALIQKILAHNTCCEGKPVYIKNQILHSMTENPRPTRAECTDIANAVIEGVDGIILTNCTAVGQYPVESLKIALSQCYEVEQNLFYNKLYSDARKKALAKSLKLNISESIASSAVKSAREVNAKLIIVITRTGDTAGRVSKYFPHVPVLCVTPEQSARYVSLFRGTISVPVNINEKFTKESLLEHGIKAAKENGLLETNDYVIAITGSGFESQSTNMLEIIKAK